MCKIANVHCCAKDKDRECELGGVGEGGGGADDYDCGGGDVHIYTTHHVAILAQACVSLCGQFLEFAVMATIRDLLQMSLEELWQAHLGNSISDRIRNHQSQEGIKPLALIGFYTDCGNYAGSLVMLMLLFSEEFLHQDEAAMSGRGCSAKRMQARAKVRERPEQL